MATTIDYALMAGAAYRDTRADINRFPIPSGWNLISRNPQDDATGFEAATFGNGATIATSTNIVISYAGTNPNSLLDPDNAANVGLATGTGSAQLVQAAEYYLQVKALNPNVTLTGHSLGGGLAALIGIFFGVPATTFDQAPFAQTARFKAIDLRNELAGKLDADGSRLYSDAALAPLAAYITEQQNAIDPANVIPNSNLVSTIRVDGEFTASLPVGTLFDPIGKPATVLDHGPYSSPSIDMHSQALLTAFLQSNQSAANGSNPQQTLSEATKKLTDLLGMIFDDDLFARTTNKTNTTEENLLEHLVRHEAGVRDPATGATIIAADQMVYRFTADLWKIAQDGGLTLTDNNLTKTLVAFAMQKYYEEQATGTDYGNTLFSNTDVTGGIRFDRTDVAANLADAKGYNLYFLSYLDNLSTSEREAVNQMLPTLTDWFVQAGSAPMNATASGNSAFMLGGSGGDNMTGGSQADLLVGSGGNDTLDGGTGADTMAGGSGDDDYTVDDAGDKVIEETDAGTDTVHSSVSYTLPDNVEKLILTGTASIDGTGNVLDNVLGVDTVLANGQKATNGFAALRDLDANGDNVFDVHDTRFADVRIWRDLNQDGARQANELKSLPESGVQSIHLTGTEINYGDALLVQSGGWVRDLREAVALKRLVRPIGIGGESMCGIALSQIMRNFGRMTCAS